MKISPFQAVVLALFAVAIIAGLIVLATSKTKGGSGSGIPVVIWGAIPSASFNAATADLTAGNDGLKISYLEKRPESFDRELVEAIASGLSPDAVLLPQDLIVRLGNKIAPIPFGVFSLRDFREAFIEEGELFLNANGIIGMPFSVDPLVMYWNRDLLSNAGLVLPPKTWDEFITLTPLLTKKDKNLNLLQSAVALGEYRNIANAKEIISAFFLQAGNPIMAYGRDGLQSALVSPSISAVGAINFYTDFANPVKPDYSWNRALPNSRSAFASGDLAFYFGFASEVSAIRNLNPNLNFDVAYFPQPKGAATAVTFGRMHGLAALRTSQNSDTVSNILAITSEAPIFRFASATGLPPVRRSLLAANPADPYQIIFYNSAIHARSWLDPNPQESARIFQNMIESITGGVLEAASAIDLAGRNLNSL